MRWLICCAAILGALSVGSVCLGRDVQFQWDANTETDVVGYKIYYKAGSSREPLDGVGLPQGGSPIDVGNVTSFTVSGFDPAVNYYLAVTAYNASGVESFLSAPYLLHETLPPDVAITAPANNGVAIGIAAVSVNATDASGVAKVELYVDGVLQDTKLAAPWTFSWDTTHLAEKGYNLQVKAYDIYNNVGLSATVPVTVTHDSTPPTISITSPADNAVVRGTVPITVNATDNNGIGKVEFYANGALKYSTNVAPFTYNWNSTADAGGTYGIVARAYDLSLNTADSASIHLVSDNTPPSVGIGAVTTPTSLTAQTLSGTASDTTGIASVTVQIGAGAPAAAAFNAGNGSWSYPLSGMAAGSNTITVTATDVAGNAATATTTIVVDLSTPTLAVTGPQYTILGAPTVSGTVSKSDCAVSVQAGSNAPVAATVSGNSWSCPIANVVMGNNTITVTATDPAGKSAIPQTATVTRLRPGPTTSDSNPNVSVADAQKVLNFVLRLETPTAAQLAQSDVAAPGTSTLQPHPDGVLDLYDVSVMLRTVVGLTW